jgi:glycosyltransferase involved in cell wall biosynthesis
MAMGRTVAATNVGGIPEVVRNNGNGLLVRPGEPRDLAAAIVRLATDDKLRHRLEQQALATIRRDFSLDRMVRETEQLYLKLIENGGRQGR